MAKKIEECRDQKGFINLNVLRKCKEKGEDVGGTNAKCWFNVDGTRVLFKEYNEMGPAFGEVLYYLVAKHCGVNCARYDLARYKGKIGTISYDFAQNKAYYEFLYLIATFEDSSYNYSEIVESSELLKIYNNKYNNLEFILGFLEKVGLHGKKDALVSMLTLDTLFIHVDRTLWNFGILIDEEKNDMELTPIYDNSFVLCLQESKEYLENIMERLSKEGGFSKNDSFSKNIENEDPINELVLFYKDSDDHTRGIIENIILKADADKIIDEMVKMYEIDDFLVSWAKTLLNFRRNAILSMIKSVRIDEDINSTPNFKFAKKY